MIDHDDLEKLLKSVLPLAQKMVKENGELHPFGGTVLRSGERSLVQVKPEGMQYAQMLELLVAAMAKQAKAGELRGSIVCTFGRVAPPGQSEEVDAVLMDVEHEDGECFQLVMPYKKNPLNYSFSPLIKNPGKHKVFVHKAHALH